jgi:hypothetical protein
MTKPILIGLTGYAGTGKDTVRSLLEQDHDFDGIAFADPIRDMLGVLLDSMEIPRDWMIERDLKEQDIPSLGVSYRKMAQALGTEWGRALNSDLWLDIAAEKIRVCQQYGNPGVVISDVRFVNEAQWIKAQGGLIWKIIRPDVEPVREHVSEGLIASLPYDYVIDNCSTVENLAMAVDSALAYCLKVTPDMLQFVGTPTETQP